MNNWEPCPRCGSNSVKKEKPMQTFFSAALGGFAMAGCGIWLLIIPFLGFLLIAVGGISFVFGLAMLIISGITGSAKQLTCSDCELTWEVGKYQ